MWLRAGPPKVAPPAGALPVASPIAGAGRSWAGPPPPSQSAVQLELRTAAPTTHEEAAISLRPIYIYTYSCTYIYIYRMARNLAHKSVM